MKKMKGILSLILVLCCMLQFAAPMAMAAPAEGATLDVIAYEFDSEASEYVETAEISYSGAGDVDELATVGMSVIAEGEGKFISRVFFAADEADALAKLAGDESINWAVYLADDGTVILDSDIFNDALTDADLAEALYGDISGSSLLLVAVVEPIPSEVSLTYDAGILTLGTIVVADGESSNELTVASGSATVADISSAAEAAANESYHSFAGEWTLFQNGFYCGFVEPGDTITLFGDASLSAEWHYDPKYTVTAHAPEYIKMDADESYESVMARIAAAAYITIDPSDYPNLSIDGLKFELRDSENKVLGAGPVPEGKYTVHPLIPAAPVVKSDGSVLELGDKIVGIDAVYGEMEKLPGVTLSFEDGLAELTKPLVDPADTDNTFVKTKNSTYTVPTLHADAYAEAGAAGFAFTGWEVYFPSTTERVVVKPGAELKLYGDAKFTAQFRAATVADTVTVTADSFIIEAGDPFPTFTAKVTAPEFEGIELSIEGLSYKVLNGIEVTAEELEPGMSYDIEVVLPANPVVMNGQLPIAYNNIVLVDGVLETFDLEERDIKVTFDDGFAAIEKGLVDGASKNKLDAVTNTEFIVPELSEAADKEAVSEGYHFAGWRVEYPELDGAAVVVVQPDDVIYLMDKATFTALWVVDLTITTVDREAEYNGEFITANKYKISDTDKKKLTRADHRVIDIEIEYEGGTDYITKKNQPASSSVVESSVIIRDRMDNDVTAQYNITIKPAKITVTKCDDKVVIKAKDAEKTYDGTELTEGEVEATGLKGKDEVVQVVTKGAPVRPEESCANELVSYEIMNERGVVVTDCYSNIVEEDGFLTIKPKKATITAPDDEEMIRDGSAYELDADDIEFEGLLIGHHPEVKVQYLLDGVKTTPKDVGYYVIDLYDVKIIGEDDKDYTSCYELEVVDGGVFIKSTAESSVLTITAPSQTWVYDGEAHVYQTMNSADPKQVSGLKDGDTITFKFSASSTITNAGTKANIIEQVVIKDKNGKAVDPEKYDIKKVPGTLTVTKFPITVTAVSDSKTYDGTALVNKKVEVTELANKDHTISVDYSILDSKGKVAKNGAVDVGEYTKKITDVKIMDGKTDVTDNYEITKVDGKLTIKKGTGTSSSTNDGNGAVKTGDAANLGLWIGLLAVSAVVVAAIVVIVIKKGKNKDQQ